MRVTRLIAPLFLLPLFACSDLPSVDGVVYSEVTNMCPKATVLSDASLLTRFRPGAKAGTGIMLTAEIAPPEIKCGWTRGSPWAEADIAFEMQARPGQASGENMEDIRYFVSVVGPRNNILSRETYSQPVSFDGNGTQSYREQFEALTIHMDRGTTPVDYRIVVGFELTPEELAYNRGQRTATP